MHLLVPQHSAPPGRGKSLDVPEKQPGMTSQELRAAFIDFFVSRGHKHLPPATLIPDEMSTTLFTIAGMEQFVPVFLGDVAAPAPRAVTVQRCLRVAGAKSDIENVGRTGRHGTFLEMLGNFSFGDYYKREAILFAWAFLTQVMKLDESKLYVTVHTSDDEAQRLWEYEVGIASSKISRFDEDNFWTMGPTGPCGPCSEIFFDTGVANADGPHDRGPNLGSRFVEIWNLVFQQFNRTADGKLNDLPRKGVDTGAGFERMLAVANGKASMYETDLFVDLIAAQPPVGQSSLSEAEQLVRRRIIADHARAVTFLLADGVLPSNTDRGYVLRFLTRRAIRNGRLLGYPSGFLTGLVPAVTASLGSGYPELEAARPQVEAALASEEAAFNKTLERGSEMLAGLLESAKANDVPLSGRDVFTLHDTFGFPSELTREIAGEAGVQIDGIAFEVAMREQRERAREDARKKRAAVVVTDLPALESAFTGYDGLEGEGKLLAIAVDGASVEEASLGTQAQLILDSTSFYAEKGGQIGDRGTIVCGDAIFEVQDAQFVGAAIAHIGVVKAGTFRIDDVLHTAVDPQWREEIRRHHTSAHLLQRALKDIVGEGIAQAGSWVGVDRMRYDFRSPGGPVTREQQRAVAQRVNEIIRADHHLETRELPYEEAVTTGAYMMPGEKYGERVRVVRAGPSIEFCGGTHSISTGELGMFLILSESSIGSGIRRIEGVVSKAAEAYALDQQALVGSLAESLSAKPEDIGERVGRLQGEMRELEKTLAEARAKLAASFARSYVERAESIGGRKVVAALVPEANSEMLSRLNAAIRLKLHSGVVALAGVNDDSVALLISVSNDLTKDGVHAGELLRVAAPHIEGKGGGSATQAQGGGKKVTGAEAALGAIKTKLT
jgi:alanyl-tRNA synthetase